MALTVTFFWKTLMPITLRRGGGRISVLHVYLSRRGGGGVKWIVNTLKFEIMNNIFWTISFFIILRMGSLSATSTCPGPAALVPRHVTILHRDPVSWIILPESCDYMRINRDQSSTKSEEHDKWDCPWTYFILGENCRYCYNLETFEPSLWRFKRAIY